jgi:hypothetical protein
MLFSLVLAGRASSVAGTWVLGACVSSGRKILFGEALGFDVIG